MLLFTHTCENGSVLAGLSLSSGLYFPSCSPAPPHISPTQNGFPSLVPRRSYQVRGAAASGCGWHADPVWAKAPLQLLFAPFHLCLIPLKGCVCISSAAWIPSYKALQNYPKQSSNVPSVCADHMAISNGWSISHFCVISLMWGHFGSSWIAGSSG